MAQEPESPKRPDERGVKLDFLQRREPRSEGASRRPLVWGGLVLALLLMFAGTAVTTMAPKAWRPWGLGLFVASAVLYLFCRFIAIGLLNTAPKVMAIVLMLAGCFLLSKWPALSAMGILGIACLVAALAFVLLFGMGYVGREAKNRKEAQ